VAEIVQKWRVHAGMTFTRKSSATIRTSRRTVVVQITGRRHTVLFLSEMVINDDRTVILSVTFANDRALDQAEDEYA